MCLSHSISIDGTSEDGSNPTLAGKVSDGKQVEPVSQLFNRCLDRYHDLYLVLGEESY